MGNLKGEGEAYTLEKFSDHAEWLRLRQQGIGGSDVAALMGLSPYKTPYELWLEKTGQREAPDLSNNEAVMWGTILEPVIGEHYQQQHPDHKISRVKGVMRSIKRPWAQATLDYMVKTPQGVGVLEIKTAGFRSREQWDVGVPLYYQTQVQHYLSVTGWDFAIVAVLIAGQDYREYVLVRDESDIEAINTSVDEFEQKYIKDMVAPEIRATDGQALFDEHATDNGEYKTAEFAYLPELREWLLAREIYKDAKEKLDTCSSKLKYLIGDYKGIDTDKGRVTWTRSKSTKVDTKKLKEEHADIVSEYETEIMRDGGLRYTTTKE